MITGPPRIPGRRWIIGVLLGAGVLVNYIDRINLSVAAPQLQKEFNLSPEELGLLFSAFFWSYSLLQVPGGLVLDRFGVMKVGRWGAFLWAVASTITAISSGFGGIFAARVLLGVAEAPAFPASQKATGYWFPTQRTLALDRDLRFRGEIFQRHWRAAGSLRHRQSRLALGLRHHGGPELGLFHCVLADLPRSQ